MNRLQYILTAKTQYNIQSPFLFEFYNEVLNPRIGREERILSGIAHGDRYAQLRYKLCDYYAALPVEDDRWPVDDLMSSVKVGMIGMVRNPHAKKREAQWLTIVKDEKVTLSVDLFEIGLFFSYTKLTKQHIVLRIV